MIKRFSFLALAAVLALALSAPAQAAPVLVLTDAGGGSADVLGSSTGATIGTTAYPSDAINSINGVNITPTLPLSVFITLTGSGTSITGVGDKVIGGTTILYTITDGIAFGSHLNLDGTITSVTGVTPGYNFADLMGGKLSISLDKTTANFGAIVGHGGSVIGAGLGLEEAGSVPEPGSLALLGIGMSSFLALRRLFKRAPKA
jgi:hypothetical protein